MVFVAPLAYRTFVHALGGAFKSGFQKWFLSPKKLEPTQKRWVRQLACDGATHRRYCTFLPDANASLAPSPRPAKPPPRQTPRPDKFCRCSQDGFYRDLF